MTRFHQFLEQLIAEDGVGLGWNGKNAQNV